MNTPTSYIICTRSQHSVGSGRNKFGGPDTYIAVQEVPSGVVPLQRLDRAAAKRRGITIHYCGEGYGEHTGPRSMLGRAMAAARQFLAEHAAAAAESAGL